MRTRIIDWKFKSFHGTALLISPGERAQGSSPEFCLSAARPKSDFELRGDDEKIAPLQSQ
jgi:hypothetical protein